MVALITCAHGTPLGQHALEIVGTEVDELGPQTHVRRAGRLRLHPDEPFDGIRGGQLVAAQQQQLALQQGAVERAGPEHRVRRYGGDFGSRDRSSFAFQMSVRPPNPSTQLGSCSGGLEYQVVRKRGPPSRTTPA